MSIGKLAIRNRVFAVTSAELMGWIGRAGRGWECRWNISIHTQPRKLVEQPLPWAPYAYVCHLQHKVGSWQEFAGATFEGEDEHGEEFELGSVKTAFRLCVYEHAPIAKNRIVFGKRDGQHFDLTWTGAAAVYAGERFWEDIPFRVEARTKFTRVAMSLSTNRRDAGPPDFGAILAQVLDADQFCQQPVRKRVDSPGELTWQTDFVPR